MTATASGGYLELTDGRRLPVLSLESRSEIERVRTAMARRPDERWSATDSHGHEHRYIRDDEGVPRLPTLDRRSRHVECDGSCFAVPRGDCEGYDVDEWHCRECDDIVEPGFKPDYEAMDHGIPIYQTFSYTLTVEVEQAHDTIEGATYVQGEYEKPFPLLHNTRYDVESAFDGSRMTGVYVADEIHGIKRKPVGP